jgi:hypothetical protein
MHAERDPGLDVAELRADLLPDLESDDERATGAIPAAVLRRPGTATVPRPMSECADGDAGVVENQTGLVIDQAARKVEGRRGVVIAPMTALVGAAQVVLL